MFPVSRFAPLMLVLVAAQVAAVATADDLVFRVGDPAGPQFRIINSGEVEAAPAVPVAPKSQRYLISESWCQNCPAAKTRFLAAGNPKENIISIAEARDRFGVQVSSIPYEFEAAGEQPSKGTKPVQAEKSVPAPAQKQENVSQSIYNGKAGSSHKDRASLINHLANESIHRGRHSLDSLNAMTDAQLDALHNQDHSSGGGSVQQRYQYSYPQRQRRRSGIFGGFFRR